MKIASNSIWRILWSLDGTRIFSASYDNTIRCWNSDTGKAIERSSWSGHFLSISPSGVVLASATSDHSVRFWDAITGHPVGRHLQHFNSTNDDFLSLCGEFVASTGRENGCLYLWRMQGQDSVGSSAYHANRDVYDSSHRRQADLIHPSDLYTAPISHAEQGPQAERPGQSSGRSNVRSPPPTDLTPYIVKSNDHHVDGGGYSDVYKRWLHYPDDLQKEVALKAFRFNFGTDGSASDTSNSKMLRRELAIWRRLNHNNIVPFLGIAYGFGRRGTMSLVSLWMPHGSLQHFLTKYENILRLDHRLNILYDIANGLQHLHGHGFPIVHGDLTPNNVLLDTDYTARLTDFGYASLVGKIPEALEHLQRSTRRAGALRWTAPEQIDADQTSSRTTKSDVYSFGCVALQVLSGKQPWSEVREDAAVVLRLFEGRTPGRPESRPIADLHWDLIQSCWLPIQRRPDTIGIIDAIRSFLRHCPWSPPLRDVLRSWKIDSNSLESESPSFPQNPSAVEGSRENIETPDNSNQERKATSIPSSHSDTSAHNYAPRLNHSLSEGLLPPPRLSSSSRTPYSQPTWPPIHLLSLEEVRAQVDLELVRQWGIRNMRRKEDMRSLSVAEFH
ncbi:kinase-like domain-containing protein [Chiua virens]|nr:kinase-like domain-containing protein [Chiua virens]